MVDSIYPKHLEVSEGIWGKASYSSHENPVFFYFLPWKCNVLAFALVGKVTLSYHSCHLEGSQPSAKMDPCWDPTFCPTLGNLLPRASLSCCHVPYPLLVCFFLSMTLSKNGFSLL
jgi:hypothetical protein